jgi:hypothetical protein
MEGVRARNWGRLAHLLGYEQCELSHLVSPPPISLRDLSGSAFNLFL